MSVQQLILKDYRANWLYELLILAMLAAMSIGYAYVSLRAVGSDLLTVENQTPVEIELYIVGVMLSCMVVSMLFIIIDYISQTDPVFASLPVTRRQIVIAKYGTSFLQICIAFLVHFLAVQAVVSLMGEIPTGGMGILFKPLLWAVMLIFLLLMISFYFPFYFKFGMIKAALILGSLPFILIVSLFLVPRLIKPGWNLGHHITDAWDSFFNQHVLMILTEIIGIILIMMISSILLSIKFYKNKDI